MMNDSDTPTKTDHLRNFDEALAASRFAPKASMQPSIDDMLDRIENEHNRLGEAIAQLRMLVSEQVKAMNEASESVLRMIRMTSK